MNHLPEWMKVQTSAADWARLPDGLEGGRVRAHRNVVKRAANSLSTLVASAFRDGGTLAQNGLLQATDARFKVLGLLGLVVVATLLHTIPSLLLAYGFCAAAAVASRVSARRFAGVWLVVPLFSAALMLPATLNVVTPGRAVWSIAHFSGSFGPWNLPGTLAVTDAGLLVAAAFVLRTAVCVSLVVLLTSTTSSARLFKGLRALGVPQLFIMLLGMMERYLGVVARAAHEIHLAKLSRSIAAASTRREQAWVAAGMGSLFRRTYSMSGQVYLAMISRGYTGEVHLLDEPKCKSRDWVFLGCCALAGAALLVVGYR